MKCPKCGSEHVQFTTHTQSDGFSFFDSCCGFILMGPIGLLCGACGMGSSTEEFWICHDCGYKFSTESAKAKEKERKEQENEYQENLHMLSEAGDKTHEELQEDLKNAENIKETVLEGYKKCLEDCIHSTDLEIKKQANVLKHDHKLLAWTILIVCGILFLFSLEGTSFVPVILLAVTCLICIVYLVIYNKQFKKAEKVLNEKCPEFYTISMELKEARAQTKRARTFVELSNKVKKYEQNHPKK